MTRGQMEFLAEASVRYHKDRAAHYESVAKWLSILSLVLGGGAFATFFAPWPQAAPLLGLGVAILNAYRMVSKPDECAARHKGWLERWTKIRGEIQTNNPAPPAKLKSWIERKEAIAADCTDEMNVLKCDCFNRTLKAMNKRDKPYPLRWYHRLLKHWVSFPHAFDGMTFEQTKKGTELADTHADPPSTGSRPADVA